MLALTQAVASYFRDGLKIAQIRWRLIPVGRHQLAIGLVDDIGLIADLDPNVVRRAGLQQPHRG
jgi:hypothetical protein